MKTIPDCTFTVFLSDEPDIVIVDGADGHAVYFGSYEVGAHLTINASSSALVALRDAIDTRLAGSGAS